MTLWIFIRSKMTTGTWIMETFYAFPFQFATSSKIQNHFSNTDKLC